MQPSRVYEFKHSAEAFEQLSGGEYPKQCNYFRIRKTMLCWLRHFIAKMGSAISELILSFIPIINNFQFYYHVRGSWFLYNNMTRVIEIFYTHTFLYKKIIRFSHGSR